MSAPRLFFAAYPFPPRITGGTLRVVKFVKYLHEWFEGEIHVVTSVGATGAGDPELERETQGRCTVHRVEPVGDPRRWKQRLTERVRGAKGFLARSPWQLLLFCFRPFYGLYVASSGLLVFPDGKLFWSRAAMRHIARLDPQPGDVLLTTCPERSLLLAALGLKRRFPALSWVVDFRDGWFGSPFNFHTKNPLRIFLEGRMERAVFERADAIVCATDLIEEVYRARYPAAAQKLTTIFNGFDPEDFAGLEPASLDEGGFHVVHTGYAGGKRTTYRFLEGIQRVREMRGDLWARLHVHFVGSFRDEKAIWEAQLPGRVFFTGQISHREALGYMLAADLLLILLEGAEGASTAYTGKLFEYMRAGAPILVLSPPSGATRLVEDAGLGYTAAPDDIAALADCLVRAMEGGNGSSGDPARRAQLVERFDRRLGARRLAQILAVFSARRWV